MYDNYCPSPNDYYFDKAVEGEDYKPWSMVDVCEEIIAELPEEELEDFIKYLERM